MLCTVDLPTGGGLKPVCGWTSRVTPCCVPDTVSNLSSVCQMFSDFLFCSLTLTPRCDRIWCVDGSLCVSVLRQVLRFVSHRFGRMLYLFISSDALCQCPTPFSICNFCVQEAEVSMVVFFFLIKAIFEHPLLWMTTNAFALVARRDQIGTDTFYKTWQEISLADIICMA